MTTLKLINRMVFIENLFCVFRNYTDFKAAVRNRVKLLICVVTCLHLCGSILYYNTSLKVLESSVPVDIMMYYSVVMYDCFSTINTLCLIVLGVWYTSSFKTYVQCINFIHSLCQKDIIFMKIIKKLNKQVFILSFIITSIVFGITLNHILLYGKIYNNSGIIMLIGSLTTDFFVQSRYFVESLTYYVMCELVVSCLQYLNSLVLATAETLKNKNYDSDDEEFLKLKGDLHKWWLISLRLSDCTNKLSSCFGIVIGLMTVVSTVYYILLLYSSVCVLMQPNLTTPVSGHSLVIFMADYMVVTLIIVRSGQRVRDEADKLDSYLALLYTLLKFFPGRQANDCTRVAGALIRRMRAAPLRVRLLARPVQMSLLTAVLALTANYTIILLQFNHVV